MPSHTPGKRTIRFACRNCTTRLSAPLRAAGKTLRCPYCFTELVVPRESASVQREGYGLSETSEEPLAPAADSAYVTVVCPVCATRMYTTKDRIGQTMTCPDCGSPALVRAPEPTAVAEPPPPVIAEEYAVLSDVGQPSQDNREVYQTYIPVVCPTCETRLLATEREVGQELVCPDCQTRVRVPPLARKAPSQPYRRTAEEREDAYDVGRGRAGPAPAEFLLVCGVCQTRLYATLDQVGHEILCPDCYTPILVPEAPAARETGPEGVESYDVATSAPPPLEVIIPGYEPVVDDGPLRRKKHPLEERRERELAEQGQRARKRRRSGPVPTLSSTFFSGVFNYPCYHDVWNRWVGFSAGMFFAALLILISVALSNFANAVSYSISAFYLAISGPVFLVWFAPTAVEMLDIIRYTAAGADEVEHTEHLWMDRMFECLFPAFALGVALLPAVALAKLGVTTMLWAGPVSVFFLFPLLLLSMLANGTPLAPVSLSVFASLLFSCRAWAVFYVLTFLLAAATALIGWLLFMVNLLLDALVLAVVMVWAMMVYSRLLGRLAWYCADGGGED